MKKTLGIILILAILMTCCMTIFVACDDGDSDNSGSTTSTDYSHTIVFYSSQGDKLQKITQNAIQAFENKYPGWKVEHVQVGGYDDVKSKIVSDFQGKQQPDLAYCYADHVAQYLQTKKVIDLNELIYSEETVTFNGIEYAVGYTEEEVADFIEGYYNEGLAENYGSYAEYGYDDDAMLTLPFVKSTELMYYNKSALDAADLEPATTWEELWSQCATLVKKYPTCTPLAYDSEANWFITMCEQNGWDYTSATEGNHYLFNNPDTQAWLDKLYEYYELGYITTQTDNGAYTSALFTQGADDSGAIYCIGSSGGASYQDPGEAFEYGIAPIPASGSGEGKNAAISQGPSLVMFEAGRGVSAEQAAEKKIMTFLFVKELLDPTFQASFAIESGYVPCRNSVFEIEAYAEHMNGTSITAVAAKVAASMTDRYFTSPAFIGSSTARTQVGNVLLYCIQGQKTAEDALKDAVKNCGGNRT